MEQAYDYVIVGAGSAGAILAARLSENPDTTVLLLEAGPDYRSADAPAEMHSLNWLGIIDPEQFPDYQWPTLRARRTAVQDPQLITRGRGMGGSSAINGTVAHRAMLEDFDGWAEQGCTGWSGEELLPAMNRLENDLDFGDAFYHGRSGPVTIYRQPIAQWGTVSLAVLQAALDLGYPWCPDLNAPGSTGIASLPMNRSLGARLSMNDAYLEPARDRPNLTIRGETQVDQVRFDGRRAVGVRAHTSEGWTEFAGHEVLLAAGSVFTPPILVRSGIGPVDDVSALGIPLLQDLPVGRNLTDHAFVSLRMDLRPEARAQSRDASFLDCFIRYSSGLSGAGDNDMLIYPRNLGGYDDAGLASAGVGVALWQTFSRGQLRVVDPDPFALPEIDEHLLSDARDLVRLRAGVRRALELARHSAVRSISTAITPSPGASQEPVPSLEELAEDQVLDEWMLATVSDTFHITGTCRMGAPDDLRSVVDPDCRVLGFEHLRVIDGSIMPDVTRSNTNLPIMTIAEHMAARLRQRSTYTP